MFDHLTRETSPCKPRKSKTRSKKSSPPSAAFPAEDIADNASYADDLGLDSLTLLEIGVDMDYEFKLGLPEERLQHIQLGPGRVRHRDGDAQPSARPHRRAARFAVIQRTMAPAAFATSAPILAAGQQRAACRRRLAARAAGRALPARPSPRQERFANRLFLALSPRLRERRQTSPSRLSAFEHFEIERSRDRGKLSATWYRASGTRARRGPARPSLGAMGRRLLPSTWPRRGVAGGRLSRPHL